MIFEGIARRVAGMGLPMLGQALLGPAGGVVANLVAGALGLETDEPEALERALITNPAAAERLAELQERNRHDIEVFAQQAAAQQVGTVNQTMQAEARSEHAWTRTWRPFWGFVTAIAFFITILGLVGFLFAIAISGEWGALSALPAIIQALMILYSVPGAILGVTAWHRGKMQRVRAGELPERGQGVLSMWRSMRSPDAVSGPNAVPSV